MWKWFIKGNICLSWIWAKLILHFAPSIVRWCKRVPWMAGMRVSKVSQSLDIVVLLSGTLWHISASLKCLSLLTSVWTNKVARWLQANTGKCVGMEGDMEGCYVYNFFPWLWFGAVCAFIVWCLRTRIYWSYLAVSSIMQDYSFLGRDTARWTTCQKTVILTLLLWEPQISFLY
jgi:H+/Cl- antiporter ClcA